jgi:predicted CopG family antitoxin
MLADAPTTITVPSSVARRLRLYKTGGRTFAEVLEEFMDAVPPREFLEWAQRELTRTPVDYDVARQRLKPRAR